MRNYKKESLKICKTIKRDFIKRFFFLKRLKDFDCTGNALCSIYGSNERCDGCFLSGGKYIVRCLWVKEIKAYYHFKDYYDFYPFSLRNEIKLRILIYKLIKFYSKTYSIIKKHSEKDFNPETWKPGCFNDISKEIK